MNSESVDSLQQSPLSKGHDLHATPDSLLKGAKFQYRWSWERDVQWKWIDQLTEDYPNSLKRLNRQDPLTRTAWEHICALCRFACLKFVECSSTGSVYLLSDPTVSP